MIRKLTSSAALVLTALLSAAPAGAQSYPTKPVTIVVPLAAGSGMDTLARLYGEKLQAALGRPVVVENKPGAALAIGAAAIATAAPDGHTIGVLTSGPMAIGPVLYKKIAYDPQKDFVPVSLYVKSPLVLVVDPNLPIKSVGDLIKYAKSSSTPLTYSTPGAGAFQHLSTEFMAQRFGLKFTHVPYKSTPQSVTDIAAGHVNFGFAEAGATLPLIRGGKLRALAVSSTTALPTLPEVQPFAAAANAPDFEAVSWHILFAPAATPKDVVERLHREMTKIMSDPDMQKRAADIGLLPVTPPSIADTQKYIASEREKWGNLVRTLGLAGTQ
ncbi:MAG: tripartite tricarboxylate transporter substrate binding protein [Xanthobacteraceae bacterium]|nr:tripartite tricarboxylate transporter substrate binding protein [Xanthobacteraceae bacterium]